MKIVKMKHDDPLSTGGPTCADVPEQAVKDYQMAGWYIDEKEHVQSSSNDKPNKSDLFSKAKELGVAFPKNVKSAKQMADYLAQHEANAEVEPA